MDTLKIISIDPSANGVTGIIVAEYDVTAPIMGDEAITLTNFANVDFRGLNKNDNVDTNRYRVYRRNYQQTNAVLEFIKNEEPDLVILENFIMFKQQMGTFGQSFVTSELIGVIEYHCMKWDIPVYKPRSSDVYKKRTEMDYYYYPQDDGTTLKVGKPKKVKENLTNKVFKERGFLKAKRYNSLHLVVNGVDYKLKDYQIGSKNDHIIMALRHLVNIVENPKMSVETRIENIRRDLKYDE